MAQNWLNADGLFLQYGTDKTTPGTAGDFQMPGANRITEVRVDLTKLTSTAAIQDYRMIFPAGSNNYIEQVEVIAEVGAATGTSFSVGLIQMDQATIPSNYSTAFVNAMITASVATAGLKVVLYEGTTYAGGLIGSYPAAATGPYYITALSAGSAFTTGLMCVRIYWHGVGTINDSAYATQY